MVPALALVAWVPVLELLQAQTDVPRLPLPHRIAEQHALQLLQQQLLRRPSPHRISRRQHQ